MDHLVTRMRRNSENLLVLAGEEPVRKWIEPVPLPDVARAATSEIEQYGRVVLNIQPGIVVSGQAAADIVHLLAEIIENATMFSPADTPVDVTGEEVPSGGVLLEVKDSGIGISPARLEEINWRFDNPPLVDVSVSRHMGLFAVSRLAARHGVRIRLRAAQPQGLSALVWLPGNLTSRGSVRYIDQRSQQLADESFTTLLGMGSRRRATRPAMAPRVAGVSTPDGDGQPEVETAVTAGAVTAGAVTAGAVTAGAVTAPAGARSTWFRAKRPSGRARSGATVGATAGATTGAAAGVTASAAAWAAPVETDWNASAAPGGPAAPGSQGGWGNEESWDNQVSQGNQNGWGNQDSRSGQEGWGNEESWSNRASQGSQNGWGIQAQGNPGGWGNQGNGSPGGWGNQGQGSPGGWGNAGAQGGQRNDGARDRWADTGGWRIAERLGPPVLGDQTAAGLPARVPGANLFPGGARRQAPGHGQAPGRPADAAKTGPLLPGRRSPLPQRSPELARTRLSGFQLGSREAEAGTSSSGEGASR
jgi:hypothetical protein